MSIAGGGSDPLGNYGVVSLLGKSYHVYSSVFFDVRASVSVRDGKSNQSINCVNIQSNQRLTV